MIEIPVSPGEVVDKLMILEIKKRFATSKGLEFVHLEAGLLQEALEKSGIKVDEGVQKRLLEVNEILWDCEDRLRHLEKEQDFGPEFIALARKVYLTNDQRAKWKRMINEACGSKIQEVKILPNYSKSSLGDSSS